MGQLLRHFTIPQTRRTSGVKVCLSPTPFAFQQRLAQENGAPSPPRCARALLAGLRDRKLNMHIHVHKENYILFPKAIRLEAELKIDADPCRPE